MNVAYAAIITPVLVYHTKTELDESWLTIGKTLFFLGAAGYLFGMKTCGNKSKNLGGFTLFTLILLNLIHSFADGVVFLNGSTEKTAALIGHELMRQPYVYMDILPILTIFSLGKVSRIATSFLCVTGIWLIGRELGGLEGSHIMRAVGIHQFGELSTFFFIGDTIYHIHDQSKVIRLRDQKAILPG